VDHLSFALAFSAFVFSFLSLVAAGVTAVIVLGWKNSTHKVVQLAAPVEPTRVEYDLPEEVRDRMPSSPEVPTPEQYIARMQSHAEALEEAYEPLF
jgi:hypothetical protein